MPAPKDPIKYQEWIKKLKDSHYGYIISKETKRKMSESKKGEKNYWFGKHHTIKTKKKLSEINREKIISEEIKKKISETAKENGTGKWMKGKYPSKKTRIKMSKAQTGKKNHNWKNGITPINAKIRMNLDFKIWRETVFKRDNYTCQKTKIVGEKLHPHHIQNFAEYPELRFKISNGITLSEKAHQEFHKIYGTKNNTKEQLEEFLKVDGTSKIIN